MTTPTITPHELTELCRFIEQRSGMVFDDSRSRYYNQVIDQSKIKDPDWQSAEKMMLGDDRYKWGVFVEHNVPPKPGAGSCIFVHVWKNLQTTTSGCTALPENDLVKIIHWLDPARRRFAHR